MTLRKQFSAVLTFWTLLPGNLFSDQMALSQVIVFVSFICFSDLFGPQNEEKHQVSSSTTKKLLVTPFQSGSSKNKNLSKSNQNTEMNQNKHEKAQAFKTA